MCEQATPCAQLFKMTGLHYFRPNLTALHLAKLFAPVLNGLRVVPLQFGCTLHHLSDTATWLNKSFVELENQAHAQPLHQFPNNDFPSCSLKFNSRAGGRWKLTFSSWEFALFRSEHQQNIFHKCSAAIGRSRQGGSTLYLSRVTIQRVSHPAACRRRFTIFISPPQRAARSDRIYQSFTQIWPRHGFAPGKSPVS